jgi:hypothetical protein
MNRPRIVLTIDHIVSDHPGLTREALTEALQTEVRQLIAARGTAALGTTRSLESATGPGISADPAGIGAPAIARATLGALGR